MKKIKNNTIIKTNTLLPVNVPEVETEPPKQIENNYPPKSELSNKIKKKIGKTWGLGIEHEFIPVVHFKNFNEFVDFYNSIYPNIYIDKNHKNVKILIKELEKLSNGFYYNISLMYPYSFLINKFPFSNMEWTGDKHFFMLETKNMNFKDVTLKNLLQELNDNTGKILKDYNERIQKEFNKDIKEFKEPNEGSIFYVYQDYIYDEDMYEKSDPIIMKPNFSLPLNLGIDTSGSYHFWITLPHDHKDDIKSLHTRSAMLLQTIEPLLVSIYCSPDPRATKKNKKDLFLGSFRGAVNSFANYGTSLTNLYDDIILFNRQMNIKNLIMPSDINSKHWIFQLRDKYEDNEKKLIYIDKIKSSKIKPKYMFLHENYNPKHFRTTLWDNPYNYEKEKKVSIGLNIRRKEGIIGYEFRIMDHLPESELGDLAKVIYIIACMAYETKNDHIHHASSNGSWNSMMASSLLEGSQVICTKDYIQFLESQFNIKLDIVKGSSIIKVLEEVVNQCWNTCQKNKKNGLWLILEGDKTKPNIISKNKEILNKIL